MPFAAPATNVRAYGCPDWLLSDGVMRSPNGASNVPLILIAHVVKSKRPLSVLIRSLGVDTSCSARRVFPKYDVALSRFHLCIFQTRAENGAPQSSS